jgi:hypothetical protein
MSRIYVALTKEPLYDNNIKGNLYVRGVFKSKLNILTKIQSQEKTIKHIADCKLPIEINSGLKQNTTYVAEYFNSNNSKILYVLQVTIADVRNSYTYIICDTSEDAILATAMEWFEDESSDTSGEAVDEMIDDLKTHGFHDFFGYAKECGLFMYYFDLETELND